MNNYLFVWFVLSMILVLGCAPNEQEMNSSTNLDFPVKFTGKVDSIRVYAADQDILSEFIFSPLTGKDKVWISGYDTPIELDLHTGESAPLSTLYHEQLSSPFQIESIWKDSLTNEVFITLFHKGIVHFPCDGGPVTFYPVQGIQSVLNTKNEIIAGTAKGLYAIDKMNKNTVKVPGCPMDVWVKDIRVLHNDTLLINNGSMQFAYPLKAPGKMIQYQSNAGILYNNPFLKRLPRDPGGTNYRLHDDGHLTFMYSEIRLFVQDTSKAVYEIKTRPEGILMRIKSDRDYLYLLYKDAFVILHKKMALRHGQLFNVEAYFQYRERLFKQLGLLSETPLDTFLVEYQALKSDTFYKTTPEFDQSLTSALGSYFTQYWEDDLMAEIELTVSTSELDSIIEPYALVGLCMKYVRAGDLDKTDIFYQRLTERYPYFDYYYSKSVLQCAMSIKPAIDSLKRLNLGKAEYLFKEAQLKKDLVECGWTGDSYYDYTIVANNYQEILSDYPRSEYVDNAAFYFLSMMDYGDEGENYSKEQVEECKRFLKKYPDSELIPNVQMIMVSNYYSYYGELDSLVMMKEVALVLLQKIDTTEIRDPNLLSSIRDYKEYIAREIMSAVFDTEVLSPKTEFKAGEDIKVTLRLKNVSPVVRQIRLFAHGPAWTTYIGPEDQVKFTPTEITQDTTTRLVSLQPGEVLEQEMMVTKEARYWEDHRTGQFSLLRTGRYAVNFWDPKRHLDIRGLQFYVYK